MRPEDRDPAYLWNALRAGRTIQRFVSSLTQEEYLSQELTRSAVERQLEILGEAVRKLSEDFLQRHPEIPAKQIVGLRNILAHRYYEIDHTMIWKIVTGGLPRLVETMEGLLPPLPPDV